MSKLIILGTSSAIPDENHYNTHMAVISKHGVILIDCPGTPILRLQKADIDPDDLTDLVITHFHPDHVNGLPILLMHLWLLGRKQPLTIHGFEHTLERIQAMMELFEWHKWPEFFPVSFNKVPENELALVMEYEEIKISSSPVCHLMPTMGLRIELLDSNKVIAYSSDTEPCPTLIKLANNADVLIHEASGETIGHSSPAQAGRVARQAGASSLVLIHYPVDQLNNLELIKQAKHPFQGTVTLADDLMEIKF
jgi:ribonuclease Z